MESVSSISLSAQRAHCFAQSLSEHVRKLWKQFIDIHKKISTERKTLRGPILVVIAVNLKPDQSQKTHYKI